MLELVNKILELLIQIQSNQPQSWQPIIKALDELNTVYAQYIAQEFEFIVQPEYEELVNKATANFPEKTFKNIKGCKLRELVANSFLLKANEFLAPYLDQEHIFKNQRGDVDYKEANVKLQEISSLIQKCRTELTYLDKEQELKIKNEGNEWISLNGAIKNLISRSEIRKFTVAEKLSLTPVATSNTNTASTVSVIRKPKKNFFGSLKSALSFKSAEPTESNIHFSFAANELDKAQLDKQTEQLEEVYKLLVIGNLSEARTRYNVLSKGIYKPDAKIYFIQKAPINASLAERIEEVMVSQDDRVKITVSNAFNFVRKIIENYEEILGAFKKNIDDINELLPKTPKNDTEKFLPVNFKIRELLSGYKRLQDIRVFQDGMASYYDLRQQLINICCDYIPLAFEQAEFALKILQIGNVDKKTNLFVAETKALLSELHKLLPDLMLFAIGETSFPDKLQQLIAAYEPFAKLREINPKTVITESLTSFPAAEAPIPTMPVDQTLAANNTKREQSSLPKQQPVQISSINEICQLAFKEIALGNFDAALGMLTPLLIEIKIKGYDGHSTCAFPQNFAVKSSSLVADDQPSNHVTFIEAADCDAVRILSIVVSRFMSDVPKDINCDELEKLANQIGIKFDVIANPVESNTNISTQNALEATLDQKNQSADDSQSTKSLKFIRQSLPNELYSDSINTIRSELKMINALSDGEEQEWQQIPDLVKQLINNYKQLNKGELKTTIVVSSNLQGTIAECVRNVLIKLVKENAQLLINLLQPPAVLTEDLAKQIGPQYELLKLIAEFFQEDIAEREIELKLCGSLIKKSISMWVDYIIDLHGEASNRNIKESALAVGQPSSLVFAQPPKDVAQTSSRVGDKVKETFNSFFNFGKK